MDAVWLPNTSLLWVQQKGSMRRYNFSNPAQIIETQFGPNGIASEPKAIHDAIKHALDIPDAPVQQQMPPPAMEAEPAKPVSQLRVIDRTGSYDLAGRQTLFVSKPKGNIQRFSIFWPLAAREKRWGVKIVPNTAAGSKWSLVLDEAANVLWWADDGDVGKMNFAGPDHVIVDREGRTNNFSHDFGLTDEVKEEFSKLGFSLGREATPGQMPRPGGNTDGRQIFKAAPLNQAELIDEAIVPEAKDQPLAEWSRPIDSDLASTGCGIRPRKTQKSTNTILVSFRHFNGQLVPDGAWSATTG